MFVCLLAVCENDSNGVHIAQSLELSWVYIRPDLVLYV